MNKYRIAQDVLELAKKDIKRALEADQIFFFGQESKKELELDYSGLDGFVKFKGSRFSYGISLKTAPVDDSMKLSDPKFVYLYSRPRSIDNQFMRVIKENNDNTELFMIPAFYIIVFHEKGVPKWISVCKYEELVRYFADDDSWKIVKIYPNRTLFKAKISEYAKGRYFRIKATS